MVADYTSLLLVPNYLNVIVKKNTGFSAGRLIGQLVVLAAKRTGRYSDARKKESLIVWDLRTSGNSVDFLKRYAE